MLASLARDYGKSGAGKPGLMERVQAMQMLQGMFGGGRQPAQQIPQYGSGRGGRSGRQLQNSANNIFGGAGGFLGNVNQQIARGNFTGSGGYRGARQQQQQQTTYEDQGQLFPATRGGTDQGQLFPPPPGADQVGRYANQAGRSIGEASNWLRGLF